MKEIKNILTRGINNILQLERERIRNNFVEFASRVSSIKELENLSIKEGKCFLCGGVVKLISHSPESWSIECFRCGYLFDED